MRRLHAGVAISGAVHVMVIGWIASRVFAADKPPETQATQIEIVEAQVPAPLPPSASPPAPAPDVPEPPAPVRPHRDRPTVSAPAPVVAMATTTGPAPPPHVEPPATPPPARPSILSMRPQPAQQKLATSGRLIDGELPEAKHEAPDVAPSGQLAQRGAGSESQQGVFNMRVDADGTAHLKDGKNVRVSSLPTKKAIGTALQNWYDGEKRPGETDPERLNNNISAKDTRPDSGGTVPVAGGSFDTSDWLMRRHGQDPYASKKLKVLDATRDERAQIGLRHRAAQLEDVGRIMQQNLARLWATKMDAAARKEALFELWDECAETGDRAVIEAGRAARALVIGSIRAHLPAGSPGAYTPADLAALAKQRQSKQPFAPYQ